MYTSDSPTRVKSYGLFRPFHGVQAIFVVATEVRITKGLISGLTEAQTQVLKFISWKNPPFCIKIVHLGAGDATNYFKVA